MRFLSVIIFSLTVVALTFSSCAKTPEENYLENSKKAWSLWIDDYQKQNNLHLEAVGSDGLYIDVTSPALPGATAVENGNWMRVDYTGTSMMGNVFVTRNQEVAKHQNTWTKYTHYAPQMMYIGETYSLSGMPKAQYTALKGMKEGETLTAYIPSYLGYGSSGTSFSKGYQGQFSLGASVNYNIQLNLVEVIKDVTKYEENLVTTFATTKWNCLPQDSLAKYIYALRDIYPEYIPEHADTRDSITVDSTVKIYYKGTFLDGFMFDTNIDSIARRVWDESKADKPTTYTPKSGGMIEAFAKVVPTMVYDQWVKMVCTSNYAYGYNGSSDGNTVIQPYTPLIFEFYIPTNKKTEEDKD